MVRGEGRFPSVADMSEFLVEAYQPHATSEPDHGTIAAAAEQLTSEGHPVRLVHTVQVPDDETCLYLFEAASSAVVVATAQRCGLRFERVVEATSI